MSEEVDVQLQKHSFELLLSEFRHTPKDVYRRTLLELTNYTGRRYEETISQLLAFFLDPKNEHGFGTLMINALLECLGLELVGENENIDVSTEVSTAELKRIDLLVETESCLLVIENKIYAELYNDIECYRRYGELHKSKKNLVCVVLSLRELSQQERKKAESESFKVIYYNRLFAIVGKNVKSLVSENHSFILNEYYVFLNDIIKTIHKKSEKNIITAMDKFILKNRVEIDALIQERHDFDKKVEYAQNDALVEIKELLGNQEYPNWQVFESYYIIAQFDRFDNKIGIQGNFTGPTENSLLDKFEICVLTWNLEIYEKLRVKLESCFPNSSFKIVGAQAIFNIIPSIELNYSENYQSIVDALKDSYDRLKEIVDNEN